MSAGLVFLSWVRSGMGAGVGPVDTLADPLPARSTATLGVTVNHRAERTVKARLYGPGDVAGIDPAQIIRTEPADGAVDFQPNLMVSVELDRPELPWLLTPARPDDRGRLRPWIVLVVVEAEHATLTPATPLPVLRCRLEELPDLGESWAFTHAQVSVDGTPSADGVAKLLADPERNLARLLSPRRLRPRRRYLACVIPAFEPGRKAGLGRPLDDTDAGQLRPAWTVGSGEIELPVYFSWQFGTGAQGDFEELVRRLKAREMPATLGLRDLDITNAGAGFPRLPPDRGAGVLGLEGALRGPATVPTVWSGAARRSFAAALEPRLRRPAGRVAPPIYGLQHAGLNDPAAAWPRWMRELNADPRHRAAAAAGTRVVQEHQEALMAAAWAQAAQIREINAVLRRGQLARSSAAMVYRRQMSTGDSTRLLQLTSTAHDEIAAGAESLGAEIAGNRELAAVVSPTFRRLIRPRGPVARRLAGTADDRLTAPVEDLASRAITVNPPLRPPGGTAVIRRFSADAVRDLRPERITPRWWEGGVSGPGQTVVPADPRVDASGAAMSNRVFTIAAGRVYSCVTQEGRSWWVDHGPPPGTIASGRPTAILDLHVFVRGNDGTLRELFWDGDRWAWRNAGTPPGATVADSPTGVHRSFRIVSGGLQHNDDVRQVYVCGTDGRLHEYNALSGGWTNSWRPPDGMPVSGIPGIATDPYTVLVSAGVSLWRLAFDGSKWTWTTLGGPIGGGMRGDLSAPRQVGNSYVAMVNSGGVTAFYHIPTFSPIPIWVPLTSEPVAAVLGVEGGAVWCTSRDNSRLFRVVPGQPAQAFDGPPGVARSRAGTLRGAVPVVHGAGKLFERSGAGWADYGIPKAGGQGAPSDLPPAHRRWRPGIGLMSSLVVAHAGPATGLQVVPRVGRDLNLDGRVAGGWQVRPPMPGAIPAATQGVGVAIGDISRNGTQDLLVFWVEGLVRGNFGTYRIGWDLDASGTPASWSPVKRLPTPMSTRFGSSGALTASDPVTGVDVALADLDGDGGLDLIVAYAARDVPRAFYRAGFGLDGNGDVTGGWTESLDVPAPAGPIHDVGVAVVDLDGDFRPELIVLHAHAPGGVSRLRYHVGWNINARGFVRGHGGSAWSSFDIGGDAPGNVRGAGLVAADFTGSEHTDLAVVLVEEAPGGDRVTYRIGSDFGAQGVPAAWTAPRPLDPGGPLGAGTVGAAATLGDFDPAQTVRRAALGTAFRTAAAAHQELLTKARVLAGADDAARLDAVTLAGAVPAGVDPETTVTDRVMNRIEGVSADELKQLGDPLNPLVAAPVFVQPMYQPLAELSQELLLPGVGDVPPETVTLLSAGTAFIEAYLVGLNHEMARELLWREFPADRSTTFFRQFWDVRGAAPGGGPLTDIPPISQWSPTAALGGSATSVGGPDMLLLLVRGELLRRYPTAAIYARRAVWAGERRELAADVKQPQFTGRLEPDLVFFGFPLTAAQALGDDRDAGYFFVIEQPPAAARFGIDARPADGDFGGAPALWRDLTEGHLAETAEEDEAREQLRIAPPPFDPGELPLYATDPQHPVAPVFAWGHNAAHMAQILFQPPVRLAVHATDMLPEAPDA